MTREQISDAISMLDDSILQDTDEVRAGRGKRQGKQWLKRGAAAAAAVLAVYGSFQVFHRDVPEGNFSQREDSGKQAEISGSLPLLTVTGTIGGEMGFEGYMAYDISQLVNANPWEEDMEITLLPVFENPLWYDENSIVQGADFTAMEQYLREIAERLGLEEASLEITDDVPDEETQKIITEKFGIDGGSVPEGYFAPTKLIARAGDMKITVEPAMTAVISFEPARSLPEEYDFTHYASYEEALKTAQYLREEYQDLIGMENPVVNVYGGDYDIYYQQSYHIEFYEEGENDRDRILNYNFNRAAFYCNDEGKLFLARIYQPDLSRKLGDYPVITPEKAKELLAENTYITNVPYKMPGTDYVKKTELVYLTGERQKYYMPYYRFYVELPEREGEDSMKTYGAYYVPAVEESYLTNMPSRSRGEEGF